MEEKFATSSLALKKPSEQTRLSIDIGNTHCKVGIFEDLVLQKVQTGLSLAQLPEFIRALRPQYSIWSSVRQDSEALMAQIAEMSPLLKLTHATPVPLHNHYQTPETLGMDRIAAVVGAKTLYPNDDCLVVDLGTCITYDFIDAQNHFWGGNIAPGVYMRFKAMHHFTAKLPLADVPESWPADLLGQSTLSAMQAGVMEGIRFEIEGLRHNLQVPYPKIKLILTGGDAVFFETRLKAPIFAVPYLNLIGLNRILAYNVAF
ncbi:MAG: type III pantothenate kinase [Microscillaceae bacterium]